MEIHIVGGIHDDPLCRPALVQWLKDLVGKRGSPPTLIAVEMDEGIKGPLRMQRGSFKRLAAGLWGDGIDPAVAKTLAQTMAWEVDAYREVIPEVEPFFLDEPGTRSSVVEPKLYFNLLADALTGFSGDRKNPEEVAAYLSKASAVKAEEKGLARFREAEVRRQQADRERKWVAGLRHELRKDGWGVAIVGALHASRFDNQTFRRRLEQHEGVKVVEVKYLTWAPPQDVR